MTHSIIIPHRARLRHLLTCLWSIERSARLTGERPEVVVVNHGTPVFPPRDRSIDLRVVQVEERMPTFNKARLLNLGIEAAGGDVLTFLDADAIVGARWLESVKRLDETTFTVHFNTWESLVEIGEGGVRMPAQFIGTDHQPPPTRVCYRVRYLAASLYEASSYRCELHSCILECFRNYDSYPRAYEAYISPGNCPPEGQEPNPEQHLVFGNSQFSIRRDVLGDLRYDEAYVGHGFEDLDFLWRLWKDPEQGHAVDYSAVILTDADHALFHVRHDYNRDWKTDEIREINRRRYCARHKGETR